jgi:hypothetical protein
MCSRLDTLAKVLAQDDDGNESYEKLNNVGKFFPDPNHKKNLSSKGVFRYVYVSNVKKLKQKNCHQKECFTVNCMMKQLVTKYINMPNLYGIYLSAKI